MTIKEMQESHLDFLRNMADATIVTPTYSIWANAYDDYSNRFILESSSKVEPSAVNRMVAGSSPASPAMILNGNLVFDHDHNRKVMGEVKHCSFCGIANDATRKHLHILFNDHMPWINRRLRKQSENWRWEDR